MLVNMFNNMFNNGLKNLVVLANFCDSYPYIMYLYYYLIINYD